MDLRVYFQKLRKIESEIPGAHVLVVSLETPDGGKAGVKTEVPRYNAAKLIVDGRARLATAEEIAEFTDRQLASAKEREQQELAETMNFKIVDDELMISRKPGRKRQ